MNDLAGHQNHADVVVDKERLYWLYKGDKKKVEDLIGYSLPLLVESVRILRECMLSDRFDDFKAEVHKVKGALGVLDPGLLFLEASELEARLDVTPAADKRLTGERFTARLDIFTARLRDAFQP